MPYNSQALQFIYLKHTAYWVSVYSQSCAIITTISFRTFSFLPKKPCAHQHLHFLRWTRRTHASPGSATHEKKLAHCLPFSLLMLLGFSLRALRGSGFCLTAVGRQHRQHNQKITSFLLPHFYNCAEFRTNQV